MKKITYSLIALVSAIFIFSSCGKDLSVDIPYAAPKFNIALDSAELAGAKGEQILYTRTVNINIDSILEKNGGANIDEVKLKEAVFQLQDQNIVNLNFLKSVRVAVKTDKVAETTLADYPQVGIDVNSLKLNLKGLDIKEQFSNKDVTFIVYGELNGPIPAEIVNVQMALDFLISIGLL